MKKVVYLLCLLFAFPFYAAGVTGNADTYMLENQKMSFTLAFEYGSLKIVSLFNKEKNIDYIDPDDNNLLFRLDTSAGAINSSDGTWTLDAVDSSDIISFGKNYGKKLELTLKRNSSGVTIKAVFELYGDNGGLRYHCRIRNTSLENLLIMRSDVLNLKIADENKNLYYVTSSNYWSNSTDKVADAKMNCITQYDGMHGWSITLENNFATSLEEGGFKGDETEPFLFLNVFNGDSNVRVSTNPVAVQLNIFPDEEVEYFSTNLTVFTGDIIDAKMSIQEHMRERFRFVDLNHVVAINDWEWFSDGSRSDANFRNKYIPIAKSMKLDAIHVDDYWNCPLSSQSSATSRNSITPEASFTSDLPALSKHMSDNGLELGIWYSLTGGWWGVGKDLADPIVRKEKIETIEKHLIGEYKSTWQQIDLGEFFYTPQNTPYSSTTDNVYRKVLGGMEIMNTIAEKYPEYMMQMTPEADNNRARQGIGLMEMPINGIYGAYDRLDYNYSIQQVFQNFGILPFEGMMLFQYLNTFDASNSQLYSFLTGRHTSIYDKPDYFTNDMIQRTGIFNAWRKNPRITSLLNEILRPVYFNVNDANNGPYSWIYADKNKTAGILFAVAGGNKNVSEVGLNIRWLDNAKNYHIFDISMDNMLFDYKYKGIFSGKDLKDKGFTVNLNESAGKGKAFWITEVKDLPAELIYADHFADKVSAYSDNGSYYVQVEGKPGEMVRVFVYKKSNGGVEEKFVRIGENGQATAVFDDVTVTPSSISLKVLSTEIDRVDLGLSGELSEYKSVALERMDGYDQDWKSVLSVDNQEIADLNVVPAQTYLYRLKLTDYNDVVSYSNSLTVRTKGESYWRQSLFDSFEDGYYDGWKVVAGDWTIKDDGGNKVLCQNGQGDSWIYKPVEAQFDYVVQVRVRLDEGSNAGIAARMDETGDRYQFDFEAGSQSVRLFRRSNPGALISSKVEIQPGRWYTLSLKVDGDYIEGSFDGKPVLNITDSEAKGKGIGLYTWATRASFDDVSIKNKEQAKINLSDFSVISEIPVIKGSVMLPAGNAFDDTCDDFGKCRNNSGNLGVENSIFLQTTPIEDMQNPGKYIAWVEYEITPGSTIEFVTRNADKGLGIEPWRLMASGDGITWTEVDCSAEASTDYIADYWQVKTYTSTEIKDKLVKIYFPANINNWKVGLDAVSAFSMDGTIEVLCDAKVYSGCDISNNGEFELKVNSSNPLPTGNKMLEFIVRDIDDNIMIREYRNVLVANPVFYDDMESGSLKKWTIVNGDCSLEPEEKNHIMNINGMEGNTSVSAGFGDITDCDVDCKIWVGENARFDISLGDTKAGIKLSYTGGLFNISDRNAADNIKGSFQYELQKERFYALGVKCIGGELFLSIDGVRIGSVTCDRLTVNQIMFNAENSVIYVDDVIVNKVFDSNSAYADYQSNTVLDIDKGFINADYGSEESAFLTAKFPVAGMPYLSDVCADLKIRCKNSSFPKGTRFVIDLFWNNSYSTYIYNADKAFDNIWLTDIIGVSYLERPLLKDLWKNLSSMKISAYIPGDYSLETDFSIVAFDPDEVQIGNNAALNILSGIFSSVEPVGYNEQVYYAHNRKEIIIVSDQDKVPYTIFSIDGTLLRKDYCNGETVISVSDWKNGMYLVKTGDKVTKLLVY